MASIFIGVNRGVIETGPDANSSGGIIEGASTGSTDVEIRIDTGKSLTRNEVDVILDKLKQYLLDGRTAVFPL